MINFSIKTSLKNIHVLKRFTSTDSEYKRQNDKGKKWRISNNQARVSQTINIYKKHTRSFQLTCTKHLHKCNRIERRFAYSLNALNQSA